MGPIFAPEDPELFALMYDGRKLRDKETCSSLGWKDEVGLGS
jgi:hypothetical protein